MRYIKLIIIAAMIGLSFTGCSYVSDSIEGAIMDRAAFSVSATYSGGNVTVTWDETDSSSEFAGIEIYRTKNKNDEYSDYEVVATRFTDGALASGTTTTLTVDANLPNTVSSGEIYFYRVGIIHIGKDDNDYLYNAASTTDYNAHTDIDKISGYAKVVIP